MKNEILLICLSISLTITAQGQSLKASQVSQEAKAALAKKYPQANHVKWEKENGNFEANWGGASGEDNSIQFSPSGNFVGMELAIKVNELPSSILGYVKTHYPGYAIKVAGKITDDQGKLTFEAEVKGKDLIFDSQGKYLRIGEGD